MVALQQPILVLFIQNCVTCFVLRADTPVPPLQMRNNTLNSDVGEQRCGVKENRLTAHSKNGLRSILPMGKNFMLLNNNSGDIFLAIIAKKGFFRGTIICYNY